MFYINMQTSSGVETVDQFETRREARLMLDEYIMAFAGCGRLYISTRCTREWRS